MERSPLKSINVTRVMSARALISLIWSRGASTSAVDRLSANVAFDASTVTLDQRGCALACRICPCAPIRAQGHILHANAQPRWSTVTIEASSATLADSLSTAMVLATREQIDVIKARADIARVALVDLNGDLFTV